MIANHHTPMLVLLLAAMLLVWFLFQALAQALKLIRQWVPIALEMALNIAAGAVLVWQGFRPQRAAGSLQLSQR